ncbi:MAG: hypothetical protein WDN23_01525 [Edaphobacter sp.]
MTLLIAAIGLLASIYAVLPRERRLELRLRLTVFDRILAVLAFILILYCEYYAVFLSHPIHGIRFAWPLDSWPKGLKPADTIDIILLSWAALTAIRMRLRRLSRWNVDTFRKLLDELYWAGGYEEIFNFLERHRKELFRLKDSDFKMARLRRWFEPAFWFRTLTLDPAWIELADNSTAPRGQSRAARTSKLRSFAKSIAESLQFRLSWMRHLFPDYKRSEEVAATIIRNILLSEQFISQMVSRRPYLGISIMEVWTRDGNRNEFIQSYLWKLMEEPSSIFYTELRNNQNMRSGGRYYLPESNRLLYFFLSDAGVAKENSAYKPVGDYVLMLLDELGQSPDSDPYNRDLGYFREHDEWKSPIYAAIRFFDIMVEEALHQNIEWHMWLYYMPPIVEKMARNYRINDPFSDPNNEWPNRYSYLISEIFSSLRRWVTDASEVPKAQANVVLKRVDCQHENGNIPKSSLRALCECLFYALTAEELGDRQTRSLTDGVFELFFELRVTDEFQDYATVLLCCLREAGKHKSQHSTYVLSLRATFSIEESEYRIKHVEEHVDELESFLNHL